MKNLIFYKTLIFAWLLPLALLAQSRQEQETRFQNAKTLLDQQKFALALAELKPLTTASTNNAFAADAGYLYAFAAYKAGKLLEAEAMVRQVLSQHTDWVYAPDAHFLAATIYFEMNQLEVALREANLISDNRLAEDVRALKHHYLMPLQDKAQLQALAEAFPEDKVLGQIFAEKLVGGWYTEQDKAILEGLVTKFKLDKKRYLNRTPVGRKEAYNVAVMLPFQTDQLTPVAIRRNRFVTDLYAGIQMARDSLAKNNIRINLYTYDTGADTVQAKQLLALPELGSMDLIIGPIYKSTSRVVARFASERQILNINPLSQDLELTQGNPFLLLFESSIATQARQAATFAYQTFPNKTAAILFENTRDDTVFARHYRQHFVKLGGKVQLYRKVEPKRAANIADLLGPLNLEELGHLVVFSRFSGTAINTLSLIESKGVRVPLLVPAEWLEMQQISLTQLDNNEVYFLHPKFVDTTSPAVQAFREAYNERYNLPPSAYAISGFEMLYQFGTLLHQFGPRFDRQLGPSGYNPGALLAGHNYADRQNRTQYQNDNQFVPILKLDNLQLSVVNRSF